MDQGQIEELGLFMLFEIDHFIKSGDTQKCIEVIKKYKPSKEMITFVLDVAPFYAPIFKLYEEKKDEVEIDFDPKKWY